MCDEIGLRFCIWVDNAKSVLKENGNDDPSTAQIKKATYKIEEEHHAIISSTKLPGHNMANSSSKWRMISSCSMTCFQRQ